MVTSPFLYCFSRLAILEPLLTAFTLAALNLAVRLPRLRRPVWASAGIGLLFTLMMLTKTTAVFLLPALGWAHGAAAVAASGSWRCAARWRRRASLPSLWIVDGAGDALGSVCRLSSTFSSSTSTPSRQEFYWPLVSFWWSFHGGLWVDHILIPLAGLLVVGAVG